MSLIKPLWQIIHKLRSEEIEVCRTYLTAFDRRAGKFESRAEQLFNAILEDAKGELTDEDLVKKVYGQSQMVAYRKLAFRLKNKVQEVLLMDINLEREGEYSSRSLAVHQLRKKLSIAQILQTRALTQLALQTYDSIISEGVRLEVWEETLTALRLKRGIVGLSEGPEQYDRLNVLWRACRSAAKASIYAESCYNRVGLISNYRKWTEEDTLDLREKIMRIREGHERTKSFTVEFYLKYLETHYYQQLGLYSKAETGLHRLVSIIKKEEALYSSSRYSSSLLNLAENELYQGDFSSALSNSTEALKVITSGHITSLRCRELQYYACFYRGDYSKALGFIEKAINNAEESGWAFQKGKWKYLEACAHFALGNFNVVDQLLVELNPIESDKEGFNMGLRFLLILNNIERHKLDLASHRLETIRKQLSAISKKTRLPHRERMIYEVLRELDKENFDFISTADLVLDRIQLLNSNKKGLSWQILSSELIVFTEWFKSKCRGETFAQSIPIYIEPQQNLRLVI